MCCRQHVLCISSGFQGQDGCHKNSFQDHCFLATAHRTGAALPNAQHMARRLSLVSLLPRPCSLCWECMGQANDSVLCCALQPFSGAAEEHLGPEPGRAQSQQFAHGSQHPSQQQLIRQSVHACAHRLPPRRLNWTNLGGRLPAS